MPVCDSCSTSTTWEEGTGYTAAEFRRMVSMGLGPHETTLSLYEAMGIPRHLGVSQWKDGLVAQSTTGWLLCPSCAARAARYMRKPAGTGPAGHVLTETISVDKLFPSGASGATTGPSPYLSAAARARPRDPMMDKVRIALLVFASLSLVALFLPMAGWALGIRLVVGAGVAVLAYRYASYLNRSGVGWGIFSFLLPTPTLFVLPFLRAR